MESTKVMSQKHLLLGLALTRLVPKSQIQRGKIKLIMLSWVTAQFRAQSKSNKKFSKTVPSLLPSMLTQTSLPTKMESTSQDKTVSNLMVST
jgi:hypothetical protein